MPRLDRRLPGGHPLLAREAPTRRRAATRRCSRCCSRTCACPDTVRGDLEAQVAACRTGAERVQALCARYGVATVRCGHAVACDASERALRARIAELPDGEYTAETYMDHDGDDKATRRLVALAHPHRRRPRHGRPHGHERHRRRAHQPAAERDDRRRQRRAEVGPRPARPGQRRRVPRRRGHRAARHHRQPVAARAVRLVRLRLHGDRRADAARRCPGSRPSSCPAGTGQMFGIYLLPRRPPRRRAVHHDRRHDGGLGRAAGRRRPEPHLRDRRRHAERAGGDHRGPLPGADDPARAQPRRRAAPGASAADSASCASSRCSRTGSPCRRSWRTSWRRPRA